MKRMNKIMGMLDTDIISKKKRYKNIFLNLSCQSCLTEEYINFNKKYGLVL